MKPPTALIPFSWRSRTARGVSSSLFPRLAAMSSVATFTASAFSMPMKTVSKPARAIAGASVGSLAMPWTEACTMYRRWPRPALWISSHSSLNRGTSIVMLSSTKNTPRTPRRPRARRSAITRPIGKRRNVRPYIRRIEQNVQGNGQPRLVSATSKVRSK